VRTAATVSRRTHNTAQKGGSKPKEALWSHDRSTRSQPSDTAIRCTLSSQVRRRDASLLTFAARGNAAAAQHVCGRHGRISGSGHPHGAPTPGVRAPRTHRGSKGSRNRTVRRCIPASGNADSCKAGKSPAAAPSPPPRQHWTAPGRQGITALQSRLPRRWATEGPGFDANQTSRAFVFTRYLHREHSPSR
jgi:hypothetical protein